MTFTELQSQVADILNVRSSDALARIGRGINAWHRRITSGIGLNTSRRGSLNVACTLGVQTVTFTGMTSIERIIDASTGTVRVLDEVTYEELRRLTPGTSDPRRFAIVTKDDDSVTIYLDTIPQDTRELTADGLLTGSTLSGSQTPAFPDDFHDALIDGVLSDEYRKMDKRQMGKDAEDRAERRISELRMYLAKSHLLKIRQNEQPANVGSPFSSGGSGGSGSGATSYSQTGLITFMRAPSAPFAVEAGSAYVPNLIAASINGQGALALLNTVGTAQIDADSVTFAQMQNVTPNRVLGRRNSGVAADPEELTLGSGLQMVATEVSVAPNDAQLVLAQQVYG